MDINKIFKNKVLYIDKEQRVEYHTGTILIINNATNSVIYKRILNNSIQGYLMSHISLTERLFRVEPRYIDKLSDGIYLLSSHGYLHIIDVINKSTKQLVKYKKGTKNPLYFCKYLRNNRVEIVFGDYGGHDINGNVGIYRYADGIVDEISSLPGNIVDHVHRVEYDKWRDCYWIFSGDSDTGSGIWQLKCDDNKPKPFLIGKQQFRVCTAFITKSEILYATDSPIEKNHIYKVNIEDKAITIVGNLPGSCIFGIKKEYANSEKYFFATAVEPDSTLSKFRYRLSYKLGNGISDRYSHLIVYSNNKVEEIWKTRKDNMPIWLFQFGNIRFPVQVDSDTIYFCPQSCKNQGTYMGNLTE